MSWSNSSPTALAATSMSGASPTALAATSMSGSEPVSVPVPIAFDVSGGVGNAFVDGINAQHIPVGYSIVRARLTASAGSTGNITLGNASGGAQVVASTAVTAGVEQTLTLVVSQPTWNLGSRLWIGRTGTLSAGSRLVVDVVI